MPTSSTLTRVVPAVVAASVVGGLFLIVVLAGGGMPPTARAAAADGEVCVTYGPLTGLTTTQAQNARTVAAVALTRGGEAGVLVALTVALTESRLRNLANPHAGVANTGQGVGVDHDSVGLFQQRASWGTLQQRLDPVVSANLFMDRLTTKRGWQSEDPSAAAQQVQISAFDGVPRPANHFSARVGSNYQAQLAEARRLSVVIDADAARQPCRGAGGSALGLSPAGPVGPHGLPASYVIPATSSAGHTAVIAALGELGKPYVFGSDGPSAFDCSGLTQWAWQQAGVAIPHYTGGQFDAGTPTDQLHLTPGDLVLTPGSDGSLADPQHVGLFIGSGLVVEAPQTVDVVKVVTYRSFISGGLSGLRHIG